MNGRRIAAAATYLSVLVLTTTAGRAQLPAVGPEFQVNTYTTGRQYAPRVAATPASEFVVVWAGYDGGYTPLGILGQRYDGTGVAQGPEFRADSTTVLFPVGTQVAVAASAAGFVVAWDNVVLGEGDWAILARRYDATGAPQGAEFQVNTYTTNDQRRPAVAADAVGNFVVVWESYGQDTGPYARSVMGQRYDSAGVPQGGEFTVNAISYDQRRPDVASGAAGNFVVVWDGYEGVSARLFDAAGVAQGNEFVVEPFASHAAVDADAAGFVVAWDGFGDIFGRRYDDTGVALAPAFQANTFTTGAQRRPDVALGAGGDFAITWSSLGQDGGSYGYGAFVRRYDGDGTPRGDDFRVNTYTTGSQQAPAIAGGVGGGFVIAWQSEGQDGNDIGVFAQRYDPSLSTTTTTSVTSTTSSSVTTTSTTSTTTLPPLHQPFSVKRLSVKPGIRFKFVARGAFGLPQLGDDPSEDGAFLSFGTLTTGTYYTLQAGGWRGLGPGGDGSRGYKFRGTLCSVLLRPPVLKASCRDDTGTVVVPETDDVDVFFWTGAASVYCGTCGGTPAGNPDVIYKRLDCPAPAACF